MQASIGIFQQSLQQKNVPTPETPPEVFEAAERVAESHSDEIIRHRTGIYLVQYSETGPFQHAMTGWLPVRITKATRWTSGGIKEEEMSEFKKE